MRSMKFSPEIGTKNREDVPGEIKKSALRTVGLVRMQN
jgi:hypothetical protein